MATALKSGMVGHVYRAARDGGLLAIATGVWMFASTIYPALTGERATATVTSIDTGCAYAAELSVIQSMSGLAPDCSFTALAETGLVHEAKMVKLSFTSRIGAPYSAEVPFDTLNRPNLQAGDSVPVSYARDDPQSVQALPGLPDYLYVSGPFFVGMMMLGLVYFARRAAAYRTDVNAEIAELERAYRARSKPSHAASR